MWAKIFRHTIGNFSGYDSHRFAFAQVCKRWREIAFADAALWKDLSSDHPMWMLKSLTLSRSLPLHVNIAINYGTGLVLDTVVFTILTELDRIETLSIAVSDVNTMSKFLDCMPGHGSASVMKTLRLSILNKLHVTSLPRDLFRGGFDAVRTLRLDNCAPSWDSCMSHNLTTLEINLPTFTRGTLNQTAHIQSLLKLLSHIPALERLTLVNCMISIYREDWWDEANPSAVDPAWPTVHFPALTHLTVEDEILSTCAFLIKLRLPSAFFVKLTCASDIEDVLTLPPLFDAIKVALPVEFGRTMERLRLEGVRSASLRVTGSSPDGDCFDASSTVTSPTVIIWLTWAPWGENRVPQFLDALLDTGFLTSVRFLQISTLQLLSRAEWVNLFEAVPGVESIYLRGEGLPGLQDALTVDDGYCDHCDDNSIAGGHIEPLLLPALRSLHAERCELHSAEGFGSFLRQRLDANHGLQRSVVT